MSTATNTIGLSFESRDAAGKLLAEKLSNYKNSDCIILAVPRGGVAIGRPIAETLNLPLDIVLTKKIGHPQNPEYAIGSVSLDDLLLGDHGDISQDYIDDQVKKIRKTLQNRYENYNPFRPTNKNVKGKTAILVDDGIATGSTLLASIKLLRKNKVGKIIVAVPVIPNDKLALFSKEADELIYLLAPNYFRGVGAFYDHFDQVSDEEAINMLKEINEK